MKEFVKDNSKQSIQMFPPPEKMVTFNLPGKANEQIQRWVRSKCLPK